MSVNFNPQDPSPISKRDQIPDSKPKPSFFERWLELMEDGQQMEIMPCQHYCIKKWEQLDNDKSAQTFQEYMQQCKVSCEGFKSLAEWSQHN